MMWRVKNNKGFTLVELIVVMSITGILLALIYGGYSSTRKGQYVQYMANLTQTNIRSSFIDIISTKVETAGNCNGLSPVIKVVAIKLGSSSTPITEVPICNDNSGVLQDPTTNIETIDPSESLNFQENLSMDFCTPYATNYSCTNPTKTGYLYLIFTSPYGKYYSYYSGSDQITDLWTYQISNWQHNADMIYTPSSDPSIGYITLHLTDDTGNTSELNITGVGNVEKP